jgi:hypothetical protein
MATGEGSVSFEPKTIEDLRRFFEINKDKYHELLVVLTKKKLLLGSRLRSMRRLTKLLCKGLIDSRSKALSEQKYAVHFTTRRVKK